MNFRFVLVCGLTFVAACAARSNESRAFRTAPNPNGCYAEVFSQEQFRGAGDYINGPWRLSNVRMDPRWKSGVRSVRTGPRTTVTFWSSDGYRGSVLRVGPESDNRRVGRALGGAPASVQLSCN